MYQNEGQLNDHLRKFLAKTGKAIKLAGGYFQESGLPDILYVQYHNSTAHFIESKIHPRKATEKQRLFLEVGGKHGINTYLLTFYPDAKTYEVFRYKDCTHHLLLTLGDIYKCLT